MLLEDRLEKILNLSRGKCDSGSRSIEHRSGNPRVPGSNPGTAVYFSLPVTYNLIKNPPRIYLTFYHIIEECRCTLYGVINVITNSEGREQVVHKSRIAVCGLRLFFSQDTFPLICFAFNINYPLSYFS